MRGDFSSYRIDVDKIIECMVRMTVDAAYTGACGADN